MHRDARETAGFYLTGNSSHLGSLAFELISLLQRELASSLGLLALCLYLVLKSEETIFSQALDASPYTYKCDGFPLTFSLIFLTLKKYSTAGFSVCP